MASTAFTRAIIVSILILSSNKGPRARLLVRVTSEERVRERVARGAGGAGLKVTRVLKRVAVTDSWSCVIKINDHVIR